MSSSHALFCFRPSGCSHFRFRRLWILETPSLALFIILHTAYSTNSMMFTTSPLTPTSQASSSYDPHSPSSDVGHNLDGYDQTSALIAQQRDGYSSSLPPGVSTRTVDTKQLSWWRAGVRNVLMRSLVHESRILGAMQVRRTHFPMAMYPPYFFNRKNLEPLCSINTSSIPLRSVHTPSS